MYKVCEYCGANLDPWERCDCRDGIEVATKMETKRYPLQPASVAGTASAEKSQSGNFRIVPPRLSVNAG